MYYLEYEFIHIKLLAILYAYCDKLKYKLRIEFTILYKFFFLIHNHTKENNTCLNSSTECARQHTSPVKFLVM